MRNKLLKISIIINIILIFFGSYIANLYIIQAVALAVAILACDLSKIKIKKDTIIWLIFGVILIGSISISMDIQSSIEVTALIIMGIIIKIIYENNKEGEKWTIFFVNSLLFASEIHVFATILQLIFPNLINQINSLLLVQSNLDMNQQLYESGGYAGITGQTSINAFYISIFIGITFCRVLLNKEYKKTNLILFVIGMVALFLTGKRGMLLYVIFSIIFISFYLINKDKKNNLKYLLMLAIIILVAYIVLLNIPEAQNILEKMQLLEENGDVLNGRDVLWNKSMNIFKDNKILGIGIGTVQNLIGDYSHNVYIQLLAEIGIIGFSVYCVAIIISFMQTIKKMKQVLKIDDKSKKEILAVSLFIQIIYICYSFSGNPLYGQMFFVPYMIAIAIANSISIEHIKNNNREEYKNANWNNNIS